MIVKRGILAVFLALVLAVSVLAADFQAGLEAAERGDYATALNLNLLPFKAIGRQYYGMVRGSTSYRERRAGRSDPSISPVAGRCSARSCPFRAIRTSPRCT